MSAARSPAIATRRPIILLPSYKRHRPPHGYNPNSIVSSLSFSTSITFVTKLEGSNAFSGEFPIFDIPPTHPIMRTLYDVKEVPQVCAIQFWNPRFPHQTSERGQDSAEVHFRGIQDAHGRLMVVMSHNTDIADSWEREGENQEYFDLFSPRGYAIGVNVVLYAMTH